VFGKSSKKAITLITLVSIVALVMGLIGPATAAPQDAKVRKIIVFNAGFENVADQDTLIKKFGAEKLRDIKLINAKSVLLPPKASAVLENRPEVKRVEDDIIVKAVHHRNGHGGGPGGGGEEPPPPPPADQETPWGIAQISADLAWSISTGTGVKVAVIDTGIDKDHTDLVVSGGELIITNGKYRKKGPNDWNDDEGHGTHVAGTIAAVDDNDGVVGVSPDALLYAVKVLDNRGSGYASDVAAGIDWAVRNGMAVANLSLGSSGESLAIRDAVLAADEAGLVIVAAAGNSGPGNDTVIYPAKQDETIAVAASDSNNDIAYFSSRGPAVDITAPGVNILSTTNDGLTGTKSGTSMAAPHVAGTVALMLASDRSLYVNATDVVVPEKVRDKLKLTAFDIGYPSIAQGAGLIDAFLATR